MPKHARIVISSVVVILAIVVCFSILIRCLSL